MSEYNNVKNYSYQEYCGYLQEKHGLAKYNYMTKSWNRNPRSSRTKEGLVAHHKYEDRAIMLSNKEIAKMFPFEWQLKENLVYCDYLEHLLLHIMICEHPSEEKEALMVVGIGGVINFIGPELNDLYSGWVANQQWQLNCHNLVKNDKDVYMMMLKRFKTTCSTNPLYTEDCLLKSYNEEYGLWSSSQNSEIYAKIAKL